MSTIDIESRTMNLLYTIRNDMKFEGLVKVKKRGDLITNSFVIQLMH